MKAAIPQERPHRKWAIAGMVLAILFSAFHALADGMPVYRVAAGLSAQNLTVANCAATGTVTVIGIPWSFPDNRIDWRFNPTRKKGPFNPEWTWQLNRMYFWSDLARAYQTTHDEKYARAFARQAEDWLDQTGGAPDGRSYIESPWRTIEVGQRLMNAWPDAWRAFKDSPNFPAALRERFLASLRVQAKYLMQHHSSRNWLLMEMNGLHACATYFPDFPESEQYRRESARIFGEELRSQLLPDGFQYELTPDYHLDLMECACAIYRRAKEAGRLNELPDYYLSLLEKAIGSQVSLMTPAFVQPRFNDCFTIGTERCVRYASGILPGQEVFDWVLSRGKSGKPPAGTTASRYLPWAGFAAMRSGWKKDASYLCFDVGPLGRAHYHQDKLSFTFWKGDEELIFEDGGGQYDTSALRTYAISGYDHNTLLVDGLAQNRKEPLQSKEPIDAGWSSTPKRDRAFGTYDQGFGPKMERLATHRREIVFDKSSDRFVITDDVKSADGREHEYTLLFHLDTTNVTVAADGRSIRAEYGPGRRWALSLSCKGKGLRIETASGRMKPSPAGWYVGRNDQTVHKATTVFVTAPKGKDRTFVTTLRAVRGSRKRIQH